MKRLMHCPFCGEDEDVRLHRRSDSVPFDYDVCCDSCGAAGPVGSSHDQKTAKDVAVQEWNQRMNHHADLAARVAFALGGP